MRGFRGMLLGLMVSVGAVAGAKAQTVEIEYWQYVFDARVKAMNELIKRFEAANPNIKVKQTTFPYADYQTKIAAAMPAGQGPDVVQLFYGWLDNFVGAKFIQPLPRDAFPPAAIEKDFYPIVSAMKRNGEYYALPTAVRSLALMWNKRLFTAAGLNPNEPPRSLDAYVDMAKRMTQRDAQGNLVQAGSAIMPDGQDLGWYREVLVRQFGGQPYSDDARRVMYNSPSGIAAMTWYTDLIKTHRVGDVGFMGEQPAAFRSGRAALCVDGSFRVGAYAAIRGLDFGVAELPVHNNVRSNYASYWVNGISARATGAKLDAAQKFLAFITTPEAMELWLQVVGELPARVSAAMTPANINHPQFGPFIKGLEYSVATRFVQEDPQRQVLMDAIDRIRLQNQPVAASIAQAAAAEQQLLDAFYRA